MLKTKANQQSGGIPFYVPVFIHIHPAPTLIKFEAKIRRALFILT